MTTERPNCPDCHRPMVATPARRSFYCPNRRDAAHRRIREARELRESLERIERYLGPDGWDGWNRP